MLKSAAGPAAAAFAAIRPDRPIIEGGWMG
jgi:hypothetical protein